MQASDESAERLAPQPRTPLVDLRLPLLRSGDALGWRCGAAAGREELELSEIVQAARGVEGRPGAFLLGGGDSVRADLSELVTELARLRPARLGLCTPGHGVTKGLIERLRALGLQRVHVPFHSARQDAHDWLAGRAGALKAAHRAIRACIHAGMPVAAEIVLTRPTVPLLPETVELLARLGVRTLYVRRLRAQDAPGTEFVPLSPRLGLLEQSLEDAATLALARRVRVSLRDLPVCVAPRLRPLFAGPDSELWLAPDGTIPTRAEAGFGCVTCPGLPRCAGAPADYVARFGWEEFIDPVSAAPRVHETVVDQQGNAGSALMTFTWRGPHRVRCEPCADAPDDLASRQLPYESTRIVRARLVEAARQRPALLRLVGADLLAHPQAAPLIFDALRLFRRVEVAGEASAAVNWSDLDLRRLKDLHRIDVALYGPDAASHDAHCGIPGAFAATLRGVERLRAAQIAVGAYAILHDARWVPAFAEAWSRGSLPGSPRFRLSAKGSSLDALIECARALPPGAARSALLAVLPRCQCDAAGVTIEGDGEAANVMAGNTPQQRLHAGRSVRYDPCGSDPIGAFDMCQQGVAACGISGCPGTPIGWQSTARSERWSSSI